MTKTCYDAYQHWLDNPVLDEREWAELHDLAQHPEELQARFAAPLTFGTAGLRGKMGMGTAMLNVHTVRHVAQALANVLKARDTGTRQVLVCYDCRLNSRRFAREAACVLAAAGLSVGLFRECRPTPELSFAIRRYAAAAGLNITASHNPREYNGLKVYGEDGAQLDDPGCAAVAAAMEALDVFEVSTMALEEALAQGRIRWLGEETDRAFSQAAYAQSVAPEKIARAGLKLVYTPLHGTGGALIPQLLAQAGASVSPVERQIEPDGSFPTIPRPDPEFPEAFRLALAQAQREEADLILASDPDADRLGVMARDGAGQLRQFSGNQLGVLLLDYLIQARREKGTLPENAAAVKSIVTTPMAAVLCRREGVTLDEAFTGFRFLCARMTRGKAEGRDYFFAFEESCGYLIGDLAYDKDAITASLLTVEMASAWQLRGLTLWDRLEQLYALCGHYRSKTLGINLEGPDWRERAGHIMESLRREPPAEICGSAVVRCRDFLTGTVTVPGLGTVEGTALVGADVIALELADGGQVLIRPSGTEPKVKLYLTACGQSDEDSRQKLSALETWAMVLTEPKH